MLVIYTNLMPKAYAGCNLGFITLIRPKYKADKGLLEHERTHYHQWRKSPIMHPLKYTFSADYRLKAEVEAYRVQLACYPKSKDPHFAIAALCNKYDLWITYAEAKRLLIGGNQ